MSVPSLFRPFYCSFEIVSRWVRAYRLGMGATGIRIGLNRISFLHGDDYPLWLDQRTEDERYGLNGLSKAV